MIPKMKKWYQWQNKWYQTYINDTKSPYDTKIVQNDNRWPYDTKNVRNDTKLAERISNDKMIPNLKKWYQRKRRIQKSKRMIQKIIEMISELRWQHIGENKWFMTENKWESIIELKSIITQYKTITLDSLDTVITIQCIY